MTNTSFFPIAILKAGAENLTRINEPEDLPRGVSFRVILTNVGIEEFLIADEVCKKILR